MSTSQALSASKGGTAAYAEVVPSPSDFCVVIRVRHRFGDQLDPGDPDIDFPAPFVGRVGTFPFSCPHVDTSQEAILQFQYRGSAQALTFPAPTPSLQGITPEHPVFINGKELFGGVPRGPLYGQMPLWSTRLLIIQPGVLAEENILRIEALQYPWTGANQKGLDNFTIDNAVVTFKTGAGFRWPPIGPLLLRKSRAVRANKGGLENIEAPHRARKPGR